MRTNIEFAGENEKLSYLSTVKRHCRPNPCLNNGVCEEGANDFVCSCKEGFRGQRCEGRIHYF